MDDEYFKISYVIDKIPNSPASHELPTQAKINVWIISINVEEPITSQGTLDELNCHKTTHGKSKVNISIRKKKSYQRTDLEEIWSRFDQDRPVVSNIEVTLPEKPLTQKNIGKSLKGHQRQWQKESLFVQYDNNENVNIILAPIPTKSLPNGTKVLC